MTSEKVSENVVLSVGAATTSLMVLYALATEAFRLERSGARVLLVISLAIVGGASTVRYIRLRRLGAELSFLSPPAISQQDRAKYLLWLCGAAVLGAYSVYALVIDGFWVGTLGCMTSVSSMFVLGRGLLRPVY